MWRRLGSSVLAASLICASAAAAEAETVVEDEPSGLSAWLGTSDIVILVILGVGGLYYYYSNSGSKTDSTFSPTIRPISAPGTAGADSSSFVKKMQTSHRNVVIFYGSQTGTGEELAGRLAKDATRYGMKGIALDPEECDMEALAELKEIDNHLAIFCLATYGEGDPTDNAQELFEFLQRADAELDGLNFAVFGLGNKTYEHYNEMGVFTDRKLAEMGARRIHELGLGDDDGNLEEDFMLWREGFWPSVCEAFEISSVGEDVSTRQYRLTVHDDPEAAPAPERVFRGEMARLQSYANQRPPFDLKNPFVAPVAVNRELHRGGGRSCRHIEFDLTDSKLRYEAGDHAAVYPTNDEAIVTAIGEILGQDLDVVFTLTNVDEDSSKKSPFPCPTTYRTALRHYVDLIAPVRTHVLKEMAEHCADEADRDLLRSMTSTKDESRKAYSEWLVHDRRTLLDILRDLPSCKPPLDLLLELIPRLQARYYSISSSPKSDPTRVAITAVVVKYETRLKRTVDGVATRWLAEKEPESSHTAPLFIRKSGLRLPHRPTTAVIMIGPGTGFAPFRGFIQDRHIAKADGKEIGPMILYFGCRNREQDYIYRDEIKEWKEAGTLTEVHEAFSRDGAEKVYVQHLLRRNAKATWDLLQDGAHVYVCGDARNMAKDVHASFVDMAMEFGGHSAEAAKNYVKRMESQKRYQADVWS